MRHVAICALITLLVLWTSTVIGQQVITSTIGFDNLQKGTRSYTKGGFELSIESLGPGDAVLLVSTWGPHPPAMFSSYAKGSITLRRLDNTPFTLKSIDIREINEEVGPQRITFIGKTSSAQTVRKSFTTDGPLGYQTFNFPTSFRNLTSVSWGFVPDDPRAEAIAVYDNIVVSVVGPPKEDCIGFDYRRAKVKNIGGRWKIVVGSMWLKDFGNKKSEAGKSLRIIKHYRMNQQCFVGRPDPSMEYYLVNGKPPSGSLGGEDCVDFNPDNIEIKYINGRWKIVERSHWILDFGAKKDEAAEAFRIIKKYRFKKRCFVGRPKASMIYFRR